MADELRPKPVPKPADIRGQLHPDQLPGDGKVPLPSGVPMFSDYTRKQLMAAGWKDGDPIPGDLGKRLATIQADISKSPELQDTELGKNWKPVKTEFVSIEDLPEAKRAEIASYLAEYKEQVAAQKEQIQAAANIDTEIPANIQGQQRELMREQMLQGLAAKSAFEQKASVMVDDREQARPKPPEAPKQQDAAPEKPKEAPPAAESSGLLKTHCQRCNWPLQIPFDVEITNDDKQAFVAAILGIGRFEKEYALLGGQLIVIFRSLTSDESQILQKQLGHMVTTGESVGDGDYWSNLMQFRLVMSLSRINAGGNVIYDEPPLLEWAEKYPPLDGEAITATDLPRYLANFQQKGPKQEPIRRILGQQLQKFQRVIESMEVMTDNQDFWKGIGQPV